MKTKLFAILIAVLTFAIGYGQEYQEVIREGQVFVLGAPSGMEYQHLDFPKKNMIIKRGAIADMKRLPGTHVYIDRILESRNGISRVLLKRKDGGKFFRFYKSVKARPEEALEAGELRLWSPPGKEAIVNQ